MITAKHTDPDLNVTSVHRDKDKPLTIQNIHQTFSLVSLPLGIRTTPTYAFSTTTARVGVSIVYIPELPKTTITPNVGRLLPTKLRAAVQLQVSLNTSKGGKGLESLPFSIYQRLHNMASQAAGCLGTPQAFLRGETGLVLEQNS